MTKTIGSQSPFHNKLLFDCWCPSSPSQIGVHRHTHWGEVWQYLHNQGYLCSSNCRRDLVCDWLAGNQMLQQLRQGSFGEWRNTCCNAKKEERCCSFGPHKMVTTRHSKLWSVATSYVYIWAYHLIRQTPACTPGHTATAPRSRHPCLGVKPHASVSVWRHIQVLERQAYGEHLLFL